MLSRRAYLAAWTFAIGIPLALAFWALVPAAQPNMGQFLYWPATWYRRLSVLLGCILLSLAMGYAFGRARWTGQQR